MAPRAKPSRLDTRCNPVVRQRVRVFSHLVGDGVFSVVGRGGRKGVWSFALQAFGRVDTGPVGGGGWVRSRQETDEMLEGGCSSRRPEDDPAGPGSERQRPNGGGGQWEGRLNEVCLGAWEPWDSVSACRRMLQKMAQLWCGAEWQMRGIGDVDVDVDGEQKWGRGNPTQV